MKIHINKNYSFIIYAISFAVLLLFLLLGLMLSIFFVQNLFIGRGFSLFQLLFLIIGIYIVYKPITHIKFLIKNKKNFSKILNKFAEENNKAILMTIFLSIALLFLFYSNIYLSFDFFLNAALFLPIFLLNNLVFIVNVFLLKYKLVFLTSLIDLVLPISQVIYVFVLSRFIAGFLQKKKAKRKTINSKV